jgi:ribonuclease D
MRHAGREGGPEPKARYIDTALAFDEVLDELIDQPRYSIDTEFHREKTYYPKVALVQLGWADEVVLVDPLAVSLEPFAKVLSGPGLAVLHAATQDLEVLDLACGTVPTRMFDTQIAAGFLGLSTPSLASLVDRELHLRLPKDDRLTDWLARPLTSQQQIYAAADVAHLLELHDRLTAQLTERGRLDWALGECDEALARGRPQRDPAEAWRRVKELRQLRGKAFGVARALAAWREERAARLDIPVRFVLPDLALVAIAQRAPTELGDLRALRGVDDRHLGGAIGVELLAAVKRGVDDPPPETGTTRVAELARELRPAVALVSSWIGQLATDLEMDPALLGTRADIEALLRGDEDGRMSTGWRAGLVAEPVRELLDGEAAVAFEAGHGLVLVDRSGRLRSSDGPAPAAS